MVRGGVASRQQSGRLRLAVQRLAAETGPVPFGERVNAAVFVNSEDRLAALGNRGAMRGEEVLMASHGGDNVAFPEIRVLLVQIDIEHVASEIVGKEGDVSPGFFVGGGGSGSRFSVEGVEGVAGYVAAGGTGDRGDIQPCDFLVGAEKFCRSERVAIGRERCFSTESSC